MRKELDSDCGYHTIRTMFGSLWGQQAYQDLKNYKTIKEYRKYAKKTLEASKLAIQKTVLVYDETWKKESLKLIGKGLERIKETSDFEHLFAILAETYIRLSFHQIGNFPNSNTGDKVTLRNKKLWTLNGFRSVQYVQTCGQKNASNKKTN